LARYSKRSLKIYSIPPVKSFLTQANRVKIDGKKYQNEINSMHRKRKSRSMLDKNMSPKSLRKVIAQESAYRSRIVSIMLECKQVHSWLNKLRQSTIIRVINDDEYCRSMPVTTKTDRTIYLTHVLDKKTSLIDDLANTIETANYVIEDIDKAAWGLKQIAQTFELSTRPEFKI